MKGTQKSSELPPLPPCNLPPDASHVIVCVDEVRQGVAYGRVVNPMLSEFIYFAGFDDMLLKLDILFDLLCFPQASVETRSFEKKSHRLPEDFFEKTGFARPELENQWSQKRFHGSRSKLATLYVHVMYRQHASWQGKAVWIERKEKAQFFRSVLELLHLLDNMLFLLNGERYSAVREPPESNAMQKVRLDRALFDLRLKLQKTDDQRGG